MLVQSPDATADLEDGRVLEAHALDPFEQAELRSFETFSLEAPAVAPREAREETAGRTAMGAAANE